MGAVRAPLVAQASGGDSTTGHLVLISLAWPALDSIKTMLLQHLDLANEECIGLDSFESRTEYFYLMQICTTRILARILRCLPSGSTPPMKSYWYGADLLDPAGKWIATLIQVTERRDP